MGSYHYEDSPTDVRFNCPEGSSIMTDEEPIAYIISESTTGTGRTDTSLMLALQWMDTQ